MSESEGIEKALQNDKFKKLMENGELGYEEFEKGERHGSHEVTWYKKPKNGGGDKIARFVVLAATPEPEALTPKYTVEVWAGADNGERFARFLLASFERINADELTKDDLVTKVKNALYRAALWANFMTQDELTNRRVTTARMEEIKRQSANP